MNELKFSKSEVVGFLESLIMNEEATQEETDLYSNYKWNGKLTNNSTYKKVLAKMRRNFEYGF